MIITTALTGGGAERSMNVLANQLIKCGWDVCLVPINSSAEDLVTLKSDVYPLGRDWRSGPLTTFRKFLKLNLKVLRWKPQVIILNCALTETFGGFLITKSKLVVVEHAKLPWGGRESLGRIIRCILAFRKCEWVIVSSHLKVWGNPGRKATMIKNSVLEPPSNEINLDLPTILKRIVYVGRFSHEKRAHWVLEVSKSTKIPAVMIGDGSLLPELQTFSKYFDLGATFLGFKKNPWEYFLQGDLLVIPSEWEGDGLVVVEAIQRNLPLVLADTPEFRAFGLPNHNYASDCDSLSKSVLSFQDNLLQLVIPKAIRANLLNERSPEAIGYIWHNYLELLI
jgi:glycosyltransferase involved in cell wall biosynthesis